MDITNFIRDGVTYPIGDAKSRESIATAFDSTASYSAGDYAMYDGTLYKFTSSHSGEWNASHAEATCVTDELGSGGGGGNAQVMYYYQQPVNTATNAEILRITNSKINTDTVVLECTFADPSYITSDVTWTSYNGYIAFTGTCTTATTANVTMAYKTENSVSDRLLTLLWENPNPTASSFAGQTINNLELSSYDFFVVKVLASINNTVYQDLKDYIIVQKGVTRTINEPLGALADTSNTNKNFKSRNILISDTSITFSDCYTRQWNTTSANQGTIENQGNIPLAIYGVSKYSTVLSKKQINPVDVTTKTRVATANDGAVNSYVIQKDGYYSAITHTNQTSHGLAAFIMGDNELRNIYTSIYAGAQTWGNLNTQWIWLKEGTTIYWGISYVSDSRYANDLGLFYADPVSY